jgi:hypothetical protein
MPQTIAARRLRPSTMARHRDGGRFVARRLCIMLTAILVTGASATTGTALAVPQDPIPCLADLSVASEHASPQDPIMI